MICWWGDSVCGSAGPSTCGGKGAARRSYASNNETREKRKKRDNQEEENYRENESSHFTLRYSGGAEPELAREILRALEIHFSAIESELNYTPPDSIGVILYTQQAFAEITRAPGW